MHASVSHPLTLTRRALLAAAALLLLALPAIGEQRDDRPVRHVRVTWHEEPATTAIISWTTTVKGQSHAVQFDTETRGGKVGLYASKLEAQRSGMFNRTRNSFFFFDPDDDEPAPPESNEEKHADADDPAPRPDDAWFHHARLTGLKPATRYYFIVLSDGKPSNEFSFVTAPDDDRPVSILFGGDSRSNPQVQKEINEMIVEMMGKDPTILALAHGGDYVAIGTDRDDWYEWLATNEQLITKDGRLLPVIPARGNHDRGSLFNQVFNWPGGKRENFYSTQLSAKAALVTLNTEASTAGDQKKWLDAELKALRPKNRWLLAMYHRPAYPAVKRPSGARKDFVPLFEKHNVDLVLEADGHVIKRTPPIRGDRPDLTGVVYMGEGGMGVRQRTPEGDRWYLLYPGMSASGHHITRLTFSRAELKTEVVLLDGAKVLDTQSLKPRK